MTVPAVLWRVWPLTRLAAVLDERDKLRAMVQQMTQPNILGVDVEGNGVTFRLQHEIVPIIAEALLGWFREHHGENYIEIGLEDRLVPPAGRGRTAAMKVGRFILTMQAAFRPTPAQLQARADNALRELWLALEELPGYQQSHLAYPRVARAVAQAAALVGSGPRAALHRKLAALDEAIPALVARATNPQSGIIVAGAGATELLVAVEQLRHVVRAEHELAGLTDWQAASRANWK